MRLISFTLLLLSISTYGQTKKATDCFKYPKKIVKLNSREMYDNARWIIFNWLGAMQLDDTYYGQMELVYKDVINRNDTTLIHFGFYQLDTTKTKKNKMTLVAKATVGFKQSTKKCFWAFLYPFIAPSRGITSGDSLLEGQLTEATSTFVKREKNIINKCFLELAREKKIID